MTTSFYSPEGAVLTKDPITVEVPVIEDQYADFYYEHFGGTNEDTIGHQPPKHSENSPTRELPTADCCKTSIFDNKYQVESFLFIWLSKKGLASMTKSVMIMQGTEKV